MIESIVITTVIGVNRFECILPCLASVKWHMNNGKYVFSQLFAFLDWNYFYYLARKNDSGKYVKQFTCYNQLATLMFGQLSVGKDLGM